MDDYEGRLYYWRNPSFWSKEKDCLELKRKELSTARQKSIGDTLIMKAIFTEMEQKANRFIVAIGASAGGLKPLQTFFDNTPNDQDQQL